MMNLLLQHLVPVVGCIFLDAPGCGKTFLIQTILATTRSQSIPQVVVELQHLNQEVVPFTALLRFLVISHNVIYHFAQSRKGHHLHGLSGKPVLSL